MICIDTSVVLAHVLAEDRQAPGRPGEDTLFFSRLLEREICTPPHACGPAESDGLMAHRLIGRIALLELSPMSWCGS